MAEKVVEVTHNWKAEQWDWPFQRNDGIVKVVNTNEKFEVALEVQFFLPNEIEVKVLDDMLIVNCHHHPRQGEDFMIERQVHRSYKLPVDVDKASVRSHLTHGGLLVVSASKQQ